MSYLKNDVRTEHDCLYGEIQLPGILSKIIDTPEFQRLRRIKQLGGVDYVYKDATHTRYEHSIGTAYLAGLIVDTIKEHQPDLKTDPIDVTLCVQIAALCHDLGHGPLSYVFRGKVLPRLKLDPNKRKELACDVFERIWKRVVEKDPIMIRKLGSKEMSFIKELIKGTKGQQICQTQDRSKLILYQIFSNENSPLDMCMFDYTARDCLHFGDLPQNLYDVLKGLKMEKLLAKDEHGRLDFHPVLKKDYDTLRVLHRRVYQSSDVNAVEHMICDAIVWADNELKISTKYSDLDFFCGLDDQILGIIKGLENDDESGSVARAKAVLKRIDNGDYYDLVSELKVNVCDTNADVLAERLASLGSKFDPESVRISVFREEASQADPCEKTIQVFCANPKERFQIHLACEILQNDSSALMKIE